MTAPTQPSLIAAAQEARRDLLHAARAIGSGADQARFRKTARALGAAIRREVINAAAMQEEVLRVRAAGQKVLETARRVQEEGGRGDG